MPALKKRFAPDAGRDNTGVGQAFRVLDAALLSRGGAENRVNQNRERRIRTGPTPTSRTLDHLGGDDQGQPHEVEHKHER